MVFPDLPDRVAEVRARIDAAAARGGHGQRVTLVAVTKTFGVDAVQAAWSAGVHDVGENRVQEAIDKMAAAQVPVRWHLIGHLQRNKARLADQFAMVHSVDSARLADVLNAIAVSKGRVLDVLLEVNVSGEGSKFGWAPHEVRAEAERLTTLAGLRVRGGMTMAPLGADEAALRATFGGVRAAVQVLREAGHPATELSMGMTGDYEVAVEEGATMVRIGTALFGARNHD
jgi:pyridoxal phosphate enzyme (YggS family)